MKAVDKHESQCVKKFNKHCIKQTNLFIGLNELPPGTQADIYTESASTRYIAELKNTRKYDIGYMKQYGALMEKDKLSYLQDAARVFELNTLYIRFLKDGWMAWDVTNIDASTLDVNNYKRKAVKVSNRQFNIKNTEVYLLKWRDAIYIYDYKGNDVKQQWLADEETINNAMARIKSRRLNGGINNISTMTTTNNISTIPLSNTY
jgi:hypothetical protein